MTLLGPWTLQDFAARLEEIATARKHSTICFKTFLREFRLHHDTEPATSFLHPLFASADSFLSNPLPEGLLEHFAAHNELSLKALPTEKEKITDIFLEAIARKIADEDVKPAAELILLEDVLNRLKDIMSLGTSKDEALAKLTFLSGCDYLTAKWFFRILTNTLLTGIQLDSEQVEKLFKDDSNLGDGSNSLLGTFHPPMLLVKTSTNINDYSDKITKACGETFFMETKFDGERFVVHKDDDSYKFFSRGGVDYSEKLGESADHGLAARIDLRFSDDVHSCIMDCELLVWDRREKKLVGKNEKASDGRIYDVKNLLESRDDEDCAVTRTLCVFDVLHVNGVDLDQWTLTARRRVLLRLFKADHLTEDTLRISTFTKTNQRKEFLQYYNDAMQAKLEGIVIKSLYSTYHFGSRSQSFGWFKVKPDYGSHHTLDLAVVAARLDKRNLVSAFEVAALVSQKPLLFRIVGSVQPSMKAVDKHRLIGLLKGSAGQFLSNRLPDWIQQTVRKPVPGIRYVELKNIAVVEVRASGLMRDALRFPSIICIRGDKTLLECDTVNDVEQYETALRTVVDPEDTVVRQVRKRKVRQSVPTQFKKFNSGIEDPEAIPTVVLSVTGITNIDLEDLSRLGLRFTPNITKETLLTIADDPTAFKVRSAIRSNQCHVLRGDWLRRCRDAAQLLSWTDEDLIHKSLNVDLSIETEPPEDHIGGGERIEFELESPTEAAEADSDVEVFNDDE